MRDMRKGICALCEHDEIFVAHPTESGAEGRARPMAVIHLVIPKKVLGIEMPGQPVRAGQLEAYVCRACGYTQWFTLDAAVIPKEHVQMISESSGRPGPYR
jgi:hypothetical protein